MRISLTKGIIRKCECCNFNYYERICKNCKETYITRNGDTTNYCSQSCGRTGKKHSEDSKKKTSISLKKSYKNKKLYERSALKAKTPFKR